MRTAQAILIVGGGLGIGFEITKAILATAGTEVLVFGLHFDEKFGALERLSRTRIIRVQGDVTCPRERQEAMDVCVRVFGGIDTLVYCAGVIGPIERIDKVDIESVKKTFDVNVFGAIAMSQLCIPYLRQVRFENSPNAAFGKIIILSSACDSDVTYNGWMPYCTSKAAITRFIRTLAHEEPTLTVQGVYPKLTRTSMPEDIIAGKYKEIMAKHEVERFRIWNEMGDEMIEPPRWCGEAVAKLAVGLVEGGRSGETLYYDEHVPRKITGT